MKSFLAITLLLGSFIFTGCTLNFNNALKNVEIGGKQFSLEVAQTQAEREKGLMNRTSLPANKGMVFLFDGKAIQSFWMKNTLIPLQILFIDGCKIVDEQEMKVEKDPSNPVSFYVSKSPADKAIELNSNILPENILGQEIDGLCD